MSDPISAIAKIAANKKISTTGIALLVAGAVILTAAPPEEFKTALISSTTGVSLLFIHYICQPNFIKHIDIKARPFFLLISFLSFLIIITIQGIALAAIVSAIYKEYVQEKPLPPPQTEVIQETQKPPLSPLVVLETENEVEPINEVQDDPPSKIPAVVTRELVNEPEIPASSFDLGKTEPITKLDLKLPVSRELAEEPEPEEKKICLTPEKNNNVSSKHKNLNLSLVRVDDVERLISVASESALETLGDFQMVHIRITNQMDQVANETVLFELMCQQHSFELIKSTGSGYLFTNYPLTDYGEIALSDNSAAIWIKFRPGPANITEPVLLIASPENLDPSVGVFNADQMIYEINELKEDTDRLLFSGYPSFASSNDALISLENYEELTEVDLPIDSEKALLSESLVSFHVAISDEEKNEVLPHYLNFDFSELVSKIPAPPMPPSNFRAILN